MKKTLLLLAIYFFSPSLLNAVASEDDHLKLVNYAIELESKNGALAEFPFIPVESIEEVKFNITDKFIDVTDADLKHKSELENETAIIAQARIVADKHAPLLNKAGYRAN